MRESTPADEFTSQILGRIRNGVLTYSDRLELLEEAGMLGIGRFDANLIIAAVQHRCGARGAVEIPRMRRRIRALDVVGAFLAVQVLILFLAWAVFIH
jgi:hypothetical protein